MKLQNKTVLLTGAAGGIGQAIARQLAADGARMILVGRNEAVLESLRLGLANRCEGEHLSLAADITESAGRQCLYEYCKSLPDGIDVLINNAGLSEFGLLERSDETRLQQLMMTNLTAPMLLTAILLPLLKQRSEATIVNIGSIFGSIGHPGFSAYCASKFGIRGFSEALRRELADTAVQVLYFAPRATRTSINSAAVNAMNAELGNAMDEPDQVAASLVKQLHCKSLRERYLGWPERLFVKVNGILPRLVDGALSKKLPVIRRFCDQP